MKFILILMFLFSGGTFGATFEGNHQDFKVENACLRGQASIDLRLKIYFKNVLVFDQWTHNCESFYVELTARLFQAELGNSQLKLDTNIDLEAPGYDILGEEDLLYVID